MRVLRIALVRTLRRLGIKLQRWIIQFFESNFAGIEAGHRVLAHHAEELHAVFLARPRLVLESQRFEQGSLLFRRQLDKSLFHSLRSACAFSHVSPVRKPILRLRIARHHEINKLRDSRFLRARSAVAGNDDLRQPLDHRILRRREKLRTVHRRLDLQSWRCRYARRRMPTC